MTLDSLFKLLLLDADVPLCDCGGTVLQELLDEDDIVTVVVVNLCCVELAEAVRADILTVTQVGAYALQPLLHSSFGDGKYLCFGSYIVVEAIAADELIKGKGHGKGSGLLRLLLHNGQTIFSIGLASVPAPMLISLLLPVTDTQVSSLIEKCPYARGVD